MKKTYFLIALIAIPSCSLLPSNIHKVIYRNTLIPTETELRERVLTTICCDDCKHLAKVENAGKIIADNGVTYQRMHNGIKIIPDCYYGAWMTTIIELLQGHHEPQEEKAFCEVLPHLPENAVMLELGSYWGYYSMWFQKEIRGAQNFLIEPDPKNLAIGKDNFALNHMHGHFTQAMISGQSSANQNFVDWDYQTHIVDAVSIDNFVKEHSIDFIHILHSDIQGAEVEMLRGCKQVISEKRVGYFFISTHRGVHEACLQILQEAGLEILTSVTREESFSADGLIVAKLPGIPGPKHIEVSRRTSTFCNLINGVSNAE